MLYYIYTGVIRVRSAMCKGMNMLTTVTRERLIKSYVIFIYVIKRIRKSSTSPKNGL